jgi:aspartate/methionine/tyrosine aminotransferase
MKEIDLSIGAPSEPVSETVKQVLNQASWSVGYPLAAGSVEFKESVIYWAKQLLKIDISLEQIMPVAGAKEFVATLPWLLNLNKDSVIAIPEFCYPTYQDGADAVSAKVIRYQNVKDLAALDTLDLLWINSPNNPTGNTLNERELVELITIAQQKNAYVVSDETYLETGLAAVAVSGFKVSQNIKYPKTLGLYSLSKRNALAAFRVGYVIGDESLIQSLILKRRKLGLLANSPATAVASKVLADFSYPEKIRTSFAIKREILLPILTEKGFINHSPGGMFLWLSNERLGSDVVSDFAALKIKIAPGLWYGPHAENFVRISLTGTQGDMQEASERLKRL